MLMCRSLGEKFGFAVSIEPEKVTASQHIGEAIDMEAIKEEAQNMADASDTDDTTQYPYMAKCATHVIHTHPLMAKRATHVIHAHPYMAKCATHVIHAHPYMAKCAIHVIHAHPYMAKRATLVIQAHPYMAKRATHVIHAHPYMAKCAIHVIRDDNGKGKSQLFWSVWV